jgi:hypothetical protein
MNFPQVLQILNEGKSLGEREANQLEIELKSNPDDIGTRILLLGYCEAHRKQSFSNYLSHIGWIIRNHPDGEIAGLVITCKLSDRNMPGYQQIKHIWSETLASGASAKAHLNAIRFFVSNKDFDAAFECLPTVANIEVKQTDYLVLADVYELLSRYSSSTCTQSKESLLNSAILWTQKAVRQGGGSSQCFDYIQLTRLLFANEHISLAKEAATTLLAKASLHPDESGYAVHIANIMLGKIALAEGLPTVAAKYLLASTQVSNSDQLALAGPDLSLAQELLEFGDNVTVVKFISDCQQLGLCDERRATLDRWYQAIAEGRMPPHF